jgi:nucleoside-diphosphate-sugar epimerase
LATTNQPIELIAFIAALVEKFQYQPATTLEEGVKGFVAWYRNVFKLI